MGVLRAIAGVICFLVLTVVFVVAATLMVIPSFVPPFRNRSNAVIDWLADRMDQAFNWIEGWAN